MGVRKYKPTTPGQRGLVLIDRSELWKGRPVPFDALEFDEALATIDTGYDLAFLLADLDRRVGRAAANRVLNRYVARTGDAGLVAGLPLWLSLRDVIRAVAFDLRLDGQRVEAAVDVLEPRLRGEVSVEVGEREVRPRGRLRRHVVGAPGDHQGIVGIGAVAHGDQALGHGSLAVTLQPFSGHCYHATAADGVAQPPAGGLREVLYAVGVKWRGVCQRARSVGFVVSGCIGVGRPP